ncbi:MAG TPA: multifunctional CCA addition/repair protein [Burkholderiaceae bacterium]|nr:multifunctional CCA addition/repair protein [Burkholderiaceae bacterium]
MQAFVVGGSVRDELLGCARGDRDWVVVGATPEQMLAAGFKPVGRDFPVFLHPLTHEEYALARTERKTAPGYHGFVFHAAPEVTLEQDLARRDLTINAMARDESGALIDPFGGKRDLDARLLRHVSPAFVEDPVRILRLARFAARFPQFSIAPETMRLMREMVAAGEADALVAERVWQELSRGLMEQRPARMLEVLHDTGALARVLPEVARLWGVPQAPDVHPEVDAGVHLMMVVDAAARLDAALPARWGALLHDLGKGTTPPSEWPRHPGHEERSVELARNIDQRLRVPADCRDVSLLTAREHGNVHHAMELDAAGLVRLLDRCDAWRRPALLENMLIACEADSRGRTGFEEKDYPQRRRVTRALEIARAVDTGAVAQEVARSAGGAGDRIAAAVRAARIEAVRAADI